MRVSQRRELKITPNSMPGTLGWAHEPLLSLPAELERDPQPPTPGFHAAASLLGRCQGKEAARPWTLEVLFPILRKWFLLKLPQGLPQG